MPNLHVGVAIPVIMSLFTWLLQLGLDDGLLLDLHGVPQPQRPILTASHCRTPALISQMSARPILAREIDCLDFHRHLQSCIMLLDSSLTAIVCQATASAAWMHLLLQRQFNGAIELWHY